MIIGWTSTKVMFFVLIRISRWPTSADIVLTLDPYGKMLKKNFFENSKPIQSKHCMNDCLMAIYKSYVFCTDWKFKMATISGHSFNGKMLKNFFSKTGIPIQSKHLRE